MNHDPNVLAEMINNLHDNFRSFSDINEKAHSEIIKRLDIQNGRIGKLEKWVHFVIGVTSTLLVLRLPTTIFEHIFGGK